MCVATSVPIAGQGPVSRGDHGVRQGEKAGKPPECIVRVACPSILARVCHDARHMDNMQ
mgnify:CR=1 FL=1